MNGQKPPYLLSDPNADNIVFSSKEVIVYEWQIPITYESTDISEQEISSAAAMVPSFGTLRITSTRSSATVEVNIAALALIKAGRFTFSFSGSGGNRIITTTPYNAIPWLGINTSATFIYTNAILYDGFVNVKVTGTLTGVNSYGSVGLETVTAYIPPN